MIAPEKSLPPIKESVAKGKALLGSMLRGVVDTIYPPRCIACPSETETPYGLCGSCWREIHFFAGDICDLCGGSVPTGDLLTDRLICRDCDRHAPIWDRGRSAVAYEGTGRRVALALKHSDRLDTAGTLAGWMHSAGRDLLIPDAVLVPVPLHWRRILTRKYNQAAVLAFELGRRSGLDVYPDALVRQSATPALKDMSRIERQGIMAEAFTARVKMRSALAGRDIVIVDDVMTSGATLTSAANVCRSLDARTVSVLTLARVVLAE